VTYRIHDVPVEGGFLRVGEWGPVDQVAPTVIAVHGITGSHLAWAWIAEAMPEVRVIAPDLRGRGRSAGLPGPYGMARHAADLEAVIDALDLFHQARLVKRAAVAHRGHGLGHLKRSNQNIPLPDRDVREIALHDFPIVCLHHVLVGRDASLGLSI